MKHAFAFLVLLFIAASATAQQAELDARAQELLKALAEDVESLSGRFYQTVTGNDGRVKERAEGDFAIVRPGRFDWVYVNPYEQRIVADGTNLWLHDVDLEQVSVRDQTDALATSPAGILGGGADALEAFAFEGAFEADSILWAQLAATDDNSDFRAVRIGFDPESGVLAAMELGDSLSQRTFIEFSGVVQDEPVDATRFEFTPPPGADVSGTPAGMVAPESAGDANAPETPVTIIPGLG
ncbi:MAG: outer membrane lipoprotein chaperone LolA [Pseudomonadota bacterium]